MRSGKRTQDYHFIKTERDALYYAAEIPSTSWGPPKKEKLSFSLLVADAYQVTPKEQSTWFEKLWSGEMFSQPYLVLLAAEEDDSLPVVTGYNLMKNALEKHRVQITGSAGIKTERTDEETVFMLTNVYSEAPEDRIQAIRDWCYRHKDSFRLICSAGDPAALQKRMRMKFNAMFLLDSERVEERDFA